MVKWKKQHLVNTIVVLCWLLPSTSVSVDRMQWSMEFRVAAHPDKDAPIVDKARSTAKTELYERKTLIAKWVPVIERKASEFLDSPHFVIRRNTHGQVELLVLISQNDVTERDVREFRTMLDRYGKLALNVIFEVEGTNRPTRLYKLTKSSVNRYLAQIINGHVYGAPRVECGVNDGALITGDFTEQTIKKMLEGCPVKFREPYPSPPSFYVVVTPLRVVTFLVICFFLILGLLPARGLKESKHARSWIVGAVIVGIVVGGYCLGVTKTPAGAEVQTGGAIIMQFTNISILGLLLGGAIGGAVGIPGGYVLRLLVRRATHNVLSLMRKIFST